MTKIWLDKRRTLGSVVMFSTGTSDLSHFRGIHVDWDSHPASHSPIIGIFSPGIKWPGSESDETPPSSTKAKNSRNYRNLAPSHVLS